MDELKGRRELMKGYPMAFGDDPRNPELLSDQGKGVAAPPLQKPFDATGGQPWRYQLRHGMWW